MNFIKGVIRQFGEVFSRLPFIKTMPKPNNVHFRLTSRCNLTCRQCDIWKGEEKKVLDKELSLEQWKGIVDRLNGWLGGFRLWLAGGEILLYQGALELIEYCSSKNIEVGLTTNGTLINEGMAQSLVSSGLRGMNLSLDGLSHTHDYMRNRNGLFSQIIAAGKNLVKFRQNTPLYISLATIITEQNLGELEEMVNIVNDLGIDAVNFQVLDNNFGASYYPEWFQNNEFWPKDYTRLEQVINILIEKKTAGAKICNSVEQLETMKKYYENPLKIINRPCLSGDKNFIIDEYGGVRLCWSMQPISNILEGDPQGIWNSKQASQTRKVIYKCQRTCRMLNCNY